MRKNKSKKNKVPVLDEKSYAAYLEYLRNEGEISKGMEGQNQELSCTQGRVGTEGQVKSDG